MPRGRPLSPAILQTIVAEHVIGRTNVDIANRLKINKSAVCRVLRVYREAEPKSVVADPVGDFREDLRREAIKAVRAGLVDDKDSYKRATIGVQTLRGLGEFKDTAVQGISVIMSSIPAGLEGYFTRELCDGKQRNSTSQLPSPVENSEDIDASAVEGE